jgi:site-specific recombinase XerD
MDALEPLIEGYMSYLRDVSRKTARTVTDVRCTLRRALRGFHQLRPGVTLWHLSLTDYLHWIEQERLQGRSSACLAKYLCHLRGLLEYAWRSGRTDRNVLDGFQLQDDHPRREPLSLTLEEAERLIGLCPRSSALERRDRLVVLLLYGAGYARVSCVNSALQISSKNGRS